MKFPLDFRNMNALEKRIDQSIDRTFVVSSEWMTAWVFKYETAFSE